MGAAGRGEDGTQETRERVGREAVERIGGPREAHGPLGGDPLPTRAEHHRGTADPAEVRELSRVASHDEPDARSAGDGVVEDARVDDGGVDGSVGTGGGHDREAVLRRGHSANEIEIDGHRDCLHPCVAPCAPAVACAMLAR